MSEPVLAAAAGLSVVLWLGLLVLRGGFWRADQRLGPESGNTPPAGGWPASGWPAGGWPAVAAVIPARDEADGIGRAVASLLAQDYPGALRVFVVDDNSDDGTAEVARAAGTDRGDRLTVVPGTPLPAGWTGKLWAVAQGIARAATDLPGAEYLLLTDGDIEHRPGSLRRLVAKAGADGLALTSLMVKLRCRSPWERLLVPAFVFFFQKLFPFPWVNDPRRATAAAAGGCMLVRARALAALGGIERIRDQVIDDCALARLLKPQGPIWLGLTDDARSLRSYHRLRDIWDMVARTAFVQLEHSVPALLGTVLGMTLMYLVPPVATAAGLALGNPPMAGAGAGAWLLMALAYRPTLGLYGESAARGLLLPVAGVLYTAMTLDSARRHFLGRGGAWKGRSYRAPDNGG